MLITQVQRRIEDEPGVYTDPSFIYDFTLFNQSNFRPAEQIGKCTIRILRQRPHMARMYNVYIEEGWRQNQLAKHWLPLVFDYVNNLLGVRVLRAKVNYDNEAALRLYRGLGFTFTRYNPHKFKISLSLQRPRSKAATTQLRTLVRRTIHYNSTSLAQYRFRDLYRGQMDRFNVYNSPMEMELIDDGTSIVIEEDQITNLNRDNWTIPRANFTIDASMFTPSGKAKMMPKKEPRKPDLFDDVTLYEKFKLKGTAHPMLNAMGVKELMLWLGRTYGIRTTYTDINDKVSLELVKQRHSFEWDDDEIDAGGRFVQRFAKWVNTVYRRHGVKLGDVEKEDIGALIAPFWVGGESDSYYFDVVDRIDWPSGAFGEKGDDDDGGSCWWFHGGLNSSRSRVSRFSAAMPDKALALRLWSKNAADEFVGIGRCWVLRTQEGCPILFNSYGFNSPMTWAARLSKHFGFDNYKQVALALYDDFPVNGGQGVIIAIPDDHDQNHYTIKV